ncbi:MAG TPA: enoyl-CoA hydratase [Erythrobacter sp.]|mgnify:CR=1 FL=1|nr:enoyl-CoA hydratase [Erythrobacter sp.]
MSDTIIREDLDGWTQLTLNRPDKLNSLTVEMFEQLRTHIAELGASEGIGCVVLRGAGKCFSAGHDLGGIAEGEHPPSKGWHSETLRMLEKLPIPVVAAVHGHCYTGALEVALAADFIIASETARFGDTHAKFALTPVWGMSVRLPRRVGVATAKRLMFTSRMFGADEAVRIGLAEYSVAEVEFDAEIARLASEIAAQSHFSHTANKRLLDRADGKPADEALIREWMDGEGRGPDMLERIDAVMKR